MQPYFITPAGHDTNSGTTPDQAWLTVDRVNHAALAPGDAVLFQAGHKYTDATLMPPVGGLPGAPITFASYGAGRAMLKGGWFVDKDYLTFDSLRFGETLQGGNDSGHYANHIDVLRCVIDLAGAGHCGLLSVGDDWRIIGSTVRNTGDSGMRVEGNRYLIERNQILNTGTDTSIPYGKHGIYLRASNAHVLANTINGFSADGVSARYRNSVIEGCHISGGSIGIGWFQYDTQPGLSRWSSNALSGLSDAGIYVSPTDLAGLTIESFQIGPNTYLLDAGVPHTNLHPTEGAYYMSEGS